MLLGLLTFALGSLASASDTEILEPAEGGQISEPQHLVEGESTVPGRLAGEASTEDSAGEQSDAPTEAQPLGESASAEEPLSAGELVASEAIDPSAYNQRSPIIVEVAGMVCGFCASGMERSFARRHDLEDIEFSLDDSTVTLHLQEGDTLSDEVIRAIIVEAGYDVTGIRR